MLKRITILTLLICMLTSCGFHLRGYTSLPKWLDNVYIINKSGHRTLIFYLEKQLDAYGITLSENPKDADYWLEIKNTSFQQNIVSVSSSTTPRQYQLIYHVSFKLISSKGKEIMPLQELSVGRQVTINNNRILGSNYEEELTKKEMMRDAAYLILNRIAKYQQSSSVTG